MKPGRNPKLVLEEVQKASLVTKVIDHKGP